VRDALAKARIGGGAQPQEIDADGGSADRADDQRAVVVAERGADVRAVGVVGRIEREDVAEEVVVALGVAAPVGQADGHVIPRGHPTRLWVRWWSRIRFTRCSVSGLRFCMCVVVAPVACMSATAGASAACRCPRMRPIAARGRLSGR
jgi:hypothetical protein